MLYLFLRRFLVAPLAKLLFRPKVTGLENIPSSGPALLVSNHLAASDSIFLPVAVPRQIVFPAKSEYFTAPGLKGKLVATFLRSVGQIPIDRSGGRASLAALNTGLEILKKGELFGIYPEGTRSPDGRLYRGKIGVARMALETGAPVVPVAMIYTTKKLPFGKKITRVQVKFGSPLDFSRYEGLSGDRFVERSITDEIMYEIMTLSGQEYVDVYGSTVKKSMDATGASAPDVVARLQPPIEEAGDRLPDTLAG